MGETKDKKRQEPQICFVIMPFRTPQGYEEGHFRKIYEQVFVPAIEMAGFIPHRVDDEIESTMIQGKLLDQLVNAPMVLCDLSSKNPNVLYELGIRHAFDLPVVLVQEAGQSHIFDIGGITTIEYRKNRLYDEVVEDQKKICRAILETANTKKNYSIMSLAKIQPARIDNETSITQEDQIQIMLSDLSRKIDRMEDQLAMRNSISTAEVYKDLSDKGDNHYRIRISRNALKGDAGDQDSCLSNALLQLALNKSAQTPNDDWIIKYLQDLRCKGMNEADGGSIPEIEASK